MKLAGHLAAALDPVVLAEKALGLKPYPWQRKILRSDSPRVIMLCARQAGKSLVAALMALHLAIFKPGALILILSPSERQSRELLRKIITGYRSLNRPVAADAENRLSLELENGSRIHALPSTGATIRGFSSVDLLICDEAAQIDDLDFFSALPMVAASEGKVVLLSTPFGRRGFFFNLWEQGGPEWEKVKIRADQIPHLSRATLKELRTTLGPYLSRQELDVEFVEDVEAAFSFDEIRAAVSADVEPLF